MKHNATAIGWEVEDADQAFLNRLNHSWEWLSPRDKEKVKVLRVDEVWCSKPYCLTTAAAPFRSTYF